ncbi:Exportin-T [Picochlorum sp. SENEW3]|nr:Exportin-T [Picochlorum sp. SENEW3]
MDGDFERAILCVFDQTGSVSEDIKRQAELLLGQVAQEHATAWQLCARHIETTSHAEVQFWCLQTLHSIILSRDSYSRLEASAKDAVKKVLLAKGTARGSEQLPGFIRNKIAQVIVSIASIEYPKEWPSFFQDVLGSLNESPSAIDCYCRILVSVHEDIISLEVPRSSEEAKQSMEFKDAMRDNALEQIYSSWYQILSMFKDSDRAIVANLLRAVERYVHWIDIGLVANDQFMPLLFHVLNTFDEDSEAQVAAISVLREIVSKRMDAGPKLSLIEGLGLVPIAASWSTSGVPGISNDDHELAVASSKLLVSLATEILEAWKKVENGVLSLQAVGVALDDDVISEANTSCCVAAAMMDQLFPAVVEVFKIPDDEISPIVAPFMLSFVSRIKLIAKRQGECDLSATHKSQVMAIIEAAALCSRFDDVSSVYPTEPSSSEEKVMSEEEENNVSTRRQEVFALFRNAAKLIPSEAFEFVAQKTRSSLIHHGGTMSWQDAELALSLLYQIGEGATEAAFKAATETNAPLVEIASFVIRIDESIASHRLVALALLEACARYSKVTIFQTDLVPLLASKFFGRAGLGHPSSSVPPRAAYLLCRITKSLRSQMKTIARDILRALLPHLQSIAVTPLGKTLGLVAAGASSQVGTSGAGVSTPDDRMFAFEAAGLLVGTIDTSEDEQVEWLKVLNQPLTSQLESHSNDITNVREILLLQQSIEALTRLSKGFSSKMCSGRQKLSQTLLDPLMPAMHAIHAFPLAKDLRAKFLAYVHRLVDCLGINLVPRLSAIIWALQHPSIDADDFTDILVLLNQIILKFANEIAVLQSIVPSLFSECVAKVHQFLGPSWDWSGAEAQPAMLASSPRAAQPIVKSTGAPAGSTEDLRERAVLQKQYYTFLNTISQCSVRDELISPKESSAIPDLLQGATTHIDPGVRKLCIATISNLAMHWISTLQNGTQGEVFNQADIKEFAYKKFGCDILIFSLLVKPESGGIDIRDAASISLLTEVSNQIKTLYDTAGQEYLSILYQETTTRLGWSPDIAQQFTQQIVQLQGRQLKSYLKSLFLEYRKM